MKAEVKKMVEDRLRFLTDEKNSLTDLREKCKGKNVREFEYLGGKIERINSELIFLFNIHQK